MNTVLMLLSFVAATEPAPPDSVGQQVGVRVQTGFILPHAPDLRTISQTRPTGVELTYGRTAFSRAAYKRCNCFARVGAYVNYVTFHNPAELGRTYGMGGYFEPLIRYRQPLYFSLRATAGLTYGSVRVHHPSRLERPSTGYSDRWTGISAISVTVHATKPLSAWYWPESKTERSGRF